MAAKSLPRSEGRLNEFMKERSTEDQACKSLIFVAWGECRGGTSYLLAMILCLPYTSTFMRMLRYPGFDLT